MIVYYISHYNYWKRLIHSINYNVSKTEKKIKKVKIKNQNKTIKRSCNRIRSSI